jgi:hypothetical protein
LPWQKQQSTGRTLFFTSKLDSNLRKKLVKGYNWSTTLYGAETWTLQTADHKYMKSFEMWCWGMLEKICWADHVRNEEVLRTAKADRNILHTIKRWKANWIRDILHKNCLLEHITEGKIGDV